MIEFKMKHLIKILILLLIVAVLLVLTIYYAKLQIRTISDPVLARNEIALLSQEFGLNGIERAEFKSLLSHFVQITEELGVPYFLHSGTFLGAFRYNDVLPWDDDVDLVIFKDHLEALEGRFKTMGIFETIILKNGDLMKVWFKNSTFKYEDHPDYLWKWPFLDIFVFEFVDCENKVVTDSNYASFVRFNELKQIVTIKYGDIFPLQKDYSLLGINNLAGPRNPKALLVKQFGEDVLERCITNNWSHRIEDWSSVAPISVKCEDLFPTFKFRLKFSEMENSNTRFK